MVRRTLWGLAALAVAVAVSAITACSGGPNPPLPDKLDDLDPEVAKMFRNAHQEVLADRESADAWYRMGMGYQANEFFEEAQIAYERSLALESEQAQAWHQLGRVRQRRGDIEGAIDALASSYAIEPYAPSYWRRGEWLLGLGRLDEATLDFRDATKLDPKAPAGWIGMARIALERDNPQRAREILERILEVYPREPEAHLLLGNALRLLGEEEDARFHLRFGEGEPILRMDDWASELTLYRVAFEDKVFLSTQYLSAGFMDQALSMLEGLHQEKPQHKVTSLSLGRAYRLSERHAEAIAVLEQAIADHPEDPELLAEMVPVLYRTGDLDAAIATAGRCATLDVNEPACFIRKGAVLLAANQIDDALGAFEQALELDRQDAAVWRSIGDCHGKRGDWTAATSAYASALEHQAQDPDLYVRYGFAAYETGDLDAAAIALGRGLQLGVSRPEPVERLYREIARQRPVSLDELGAS